MNYELKNFVEDYARKNITLFVLIDPKRKIEENIQFATETNNAYVECFQQTKPFRIT